VRAPVSPRWKKKRRRSSGAVVASAGAPLPQGRTEKEGTGLLRVDLGEMPCFILRQEEREKGESFNFTHTRGREEDLDSKHIGVGAICLERAAKKGRSSSVSRWAAEPFQR